MARKLILSLAAASLALGAVSTASAGGYHGGHHGHHRHHGHHGHGGGGKGAAIALGVIGGAIILNELAEDRARDRYYENRYYQDRYYESRARERAYEDGYYDGRADERRYDDRYDNGAYYDDRGADYDDYDGSGLAGGEPAYGGPPAYRTPDTAYDRAPRPISAAAAYRVCLDHARGALGERGFVVSAPYRPETVEDRGGALLMTATVTASRGADMWSRAMSCEASEGRVYRLELI
ncbi:hypothetical protein [Hyphococcus sp.]|jgi:hypothetical protein|uniref:hypothetical protein n=1 Tax=Hyphococcus sp. TaxID=2038636 RepID=UPI003D0E10C4